MACVCVKLKCSLKTGIKIELLAATNPQKKNTEISTKNDAL